MNSNRGETVQCQPASIRLDNEHEWGEWTDGALLPSSLDKRRCRRCGCTEIVWQRDMADVAEVDVFFEPMTLFIGDGQ